MKMDDLQRQRAEFNAADTFARALRRLFGTAPVDDDYPQVRHEYESALAGLLDAMKANRRFTPPNRYGLTETATGAPRPSLLTTFLADVEAEVARARALFPTGGNLTGLAMVEEVGELAKAMLDESPARVRAEAVQVAAMATRVALDGDDSTTASRASRGLAALGVPA